MSTQDKVTPDETKAIAKEVYIYNCPLVMYYRTMYLQANDTQFKSYSGGFGCDEAGLARNVCEPCGGVVQAMLRRASLEQMKRVIDPLRNEQEIQ